MYALVFRNASPSAWSRQLGEFLRVSFPGAPGKLSYRFTIHGFFVVAFHPGGPGP